MYIYRNTICGLVSNKLEADTFTNPIAMNSPDPWMQYFKGYYYLIATTFNTHIYAKIQNSRLDAFSSQCINIYTQWYWK